MNIAYLLNLLGPSNCQFAHFVFLYWHKNNIKFININNNCLPPFKAKLDYKLGDYN